MCFMSNLQVYEFHVVVASSVLGDDFWAASEVVSEIVLLTFLKNRWNGLNLLGCCLPCKMSFQTQVLYTRENL